MENKGFMFGVVLGATAYACYEMGNKAKHSVEKGKKTVKNKIAKILD